MCPASTYHVHVNVTPSPSRQHIENCQPRPFTKEYLDDASDSKFRDSDSDSTASVTDAEEEGLDFDSGNISGPR
jgi:hypothetical protein